MIIKQWGCLFGVFPRGRSEKPELPVSQNGILFEPLGEKFLIFFCRFYNSNSIINLLFCLFIIVKILLTCKSHSAVEEIKKNKEFNKCKNIKPNQDDAINLMTQHRTKET